MGRKQRMYQRGMALVLAAAMTLGTIFSDGASLSARAEEGAGAGAAITVNEAAGYAEGAYVEWALTEGADGYEVYVSKDKDDEDSWVQLDDSLIRKYADGDSTYMRADALGLTAGTWYVKVVAATYNSAREKLTEVASKVEVVTVTKQDRSGFAWTNGTSSGAYNEDGSLKTGATVLYVSEKTKDKVSVASDDGKNTYTGIQNIFTAYAQGYVTTPLDVRVLGKITDPAKLISGDLNFQNKNNAKIGVTIEGVGEDAVFSGFGLVLESASNVEVRNLGFMLCDSQEGDSVSLVINNDHIWVHNCDLFYGMPGGDSDQKKGDGAMDSKKSNYVTFSYNHFWDCGKSCLLGLEENEVNKYHITYHHNWFDHSDSRHPRVRYYTAHVYNNYFDGNAKYGIGATCGSSIFAENNYFRNCEYPMKISMQGSDNGTFSGEPGGIIKAYGNYMEGQAGFINGNTELADTGSSDGNDKDAATVDATSFDAYVVGSRHEKIPDTVVTKTITFNGQSAGGTGYNNFDTADDFYSYELTKTKDVPGVVTKNAGRLNGGDFEWTFDNSVDDASSDVNEELKAKLIAYESKLVSVGGILGASEKIYCKVTFNPNNGKEITEADIKEVELNQPIPADQVPQFTSADVPEGYAEFGYWYKAGSTDGDDAAASAVKWDLEEDLVAGDMTLKAKWYTQAEADADKHGGTPIGTDTVKHSILANGKGSAYFEINGDLKKESSYSSGVYAAGTADEWNVGKGQNGRLTFNSTASIKFTTTTETSLLVVLMDKNVSSAILVDGNSVAPTDGVILATVAAGDHTLTNKTSCYVTGIMVVPGAKAPDPEETDEQEDPDNLELNVGADLEQKTYTEDTEKNGFTIKATTSSSVVVDESNKTVNSVSYSARLKTGGAGSTESKSVKFTTKGAAELYIVAASSSSGVTRNMVVAKENEDGSTTAFAGNAKINGQDADCSNGVVVVPKGSNPAYILLGLTEAGTYYIWSADGGLNIYDIKVTYPVQYTVSFETNGGSAVEAVKVSKGGTLAEPTAPTKEGVAFAGWYTDEACTQAYDFTKAVEGKFTLYAKWVEGYTVTFETNGGTAVSSVAVEKGGVVAEPTAPVKEGYIFAGWHTDAACTLAYDFAAAVNADITLYAKWTEESTQSQTFTVTFETNGGTAVDSVQVQEGTVLVAPTAPTKTGFTFAGWFTDVACTQSYDFAQAVTAAFTLYAKWTENGRQPVVEEGFYAALADPNAEFVYTGSAIKPDIIVANNGEELTEGVDYTVKYANNLKATANSTGKAAITVTGKGNLSGSIIINFEIQAKDISDEDVIKGDIVTDNVFKAVPILCYNGVSLKKNKDFTFETFTIKTNNDITYLSVQGIGNYTGNAQMTVTVKEKSQLKKFKVALVKGATLVYDGTEKEMDVIVTDSKSKSAVLEKGKDYELVYSDNVNAGSAKVTVVGKGDYSGTVTKKFTIKPQATIAKVTNTNTDAEKNGYAFVGTGVTFNGDLQVTAADGTPMAMGKDYKVAYSKNKKVGTASYKVTFLGNYKGSKPVTNTFQIRAANLADAKVVIPDKVNNYKKPMANLSAPYISVGNVVLKKSDYTCSYYFDEACTKPIDKANPIKFTESDDLIPVYVKIEGKGNYAGSSIVESYHVGVSVYNDLSKAKVTIVDDSGNKLSKVGYTGAEIEPKVTVTLDGSTVPAEEYTVEYIGNVNKGKATVIVIGTGAGNYAGSKVATFSIVSGNVQSLVKK